MQTNHHLHQPSVDQGWSGGKVLSLLVLFCQDVQLKLHKSPSTSHSGRVENLNDFCETIVESYSSNVHLHYTWYTFIYVSIPDSTVYIVMFAVHNSISTMQVW